MPVRLYPLLLSGVLLLAACGGQSNRTTVPGAASDSAAVSVERHGVAQPSAPVVLFFGDSITAGYGLDPDDAFPAILQRRADSLGISARMVDAGLSGETTAGGLRRIGWLLRQPVHVFVLELGGNDGLRGISLDETRRNLLGIVDSVRTRYPDVEVVLAGMMIPPNLGPDYSAGFRDLFPDVASQADIDLIPFLLEGVGGVAHLMQSDGLHPTAEGHRIIADTVWPYLLPYLAPAG